MLSYLRQTSPARLVFLLLAISTCYRLWFITQMGLVPDEAYYWLWSKHLAASYRDKGPGIAWTIALGTHLFGNTAFGIRFFAAMLGAGVGWLIFVIARRLYDDWTGLWCVILASVIPMMAVGAILMTIDSLSVFFWALALLIFWQAVQRDKLSDWVWLGLAIGAGFLAKFTNGVQLGCIAFFLLWSKEHRPLLFSRKMLALLVSFSLCITPIIWWNIQTGWVHATALHSRSGVTNTFQIHPLELLSFLGLQFAVVSPLIMAGMFIAVGALCWKRREDLRVRFLASHFIPLYALFMFFSVNSAGKANWAAPALVTGIVLTVIFWRELVAQKPVWRWGIGAALGIALLMTILMHDTALLHLPPRKDPLRRAQGWADFTTHVQQAREKQQANLLIGNHYSQASMMSFLLPDQPNAYLLPAPYGASQFTLWPGYDLKPETRALYVTDSTDPLPKSLKDQFGKVQLVDDFWSTHHGRPMTRFFIYLCTRN